jgi:hypothetical protein
MWLSISDTQSRELMIGAGMGHYVNRNIQEGWAGVTVGKKQYNVRMSRHLRPAIQDMCVGPLRIECTRPPERMRFILDENPAGIAFDIEFETEFNPHVEDHHLDIVNGKVVHDLSRYNIIGSASGSVAYPGGQAKVTAEYWKGGRDHSWGVQPDQTNDSHPTSHVSHKGSLYTLIYAQFENWAVLIYVHERAPGIHDYLTGSVMRRRGTEEENLRIVSFGHDYRFRPGSPILEAESATISFTTEDGNNHQIECVFYEPRYFLRSALYMGYRGWSQGADKGPYYFENDIWDLSDESRLREAAVGNGGSDHHAICKTPDGQTGHAAFEYFVTKGYPKYQEFI